ncbi:CPBP family intramembrane glutamic endopeptidase [Neobacillus terrae]|uniref:CPBP family intramembrane glutamic endopeptidase n=1 Tax=Neobacillus terrae TaxID=3034837 RepID=UPI00140827CF|nr:type II CAAX endopeptidase family protein [Neobacillus terrae]NHM33003.1 CPBP family intramembrane metalloprotease [Neobacillus terrae]
MQLNLNFEAKAKICGVKTLIFYLLVFYFVWALKELWVINYFHLFSETTYALFNASAKVLVWIVPAWLYVKYYLNTNPMYYFNMNINVKKGLFWGIILSLCYGLLCFAIAVYLDKQGVFHFLLPLDSYIDGFLVVGITEEIVFRGLILKEINKRISFWKANVITALLFLFIHYPIWIHNGTFFHFASHVFIFLLGLIFGYIYKKTSSLWSVVILHSFYDFFISVL